MYIREMMTNKITLIFLMLCCRNVFSQIDTSNKFVESTRITKKIPKDFYMPKGYKYFDVIDNVDLTADGVNDLIIHWEKKDLVDGDLTYVNIYTKKNDTIFSGLTVLNNLYPMYFHEYDLKYKVKDKNLEEIHAKLTLAGADRFKVEFKKNVIWIELFTEVQAGVDVFFSYDTQKQNWFLSKEIYWVGDNLKSVKQVRQTKLIKNGIAIEKFNMLNYLHD